MWRLVVLLSLKQPTTKQPEATSLEKADGEVTEIIIEDWVAVD